MKKLLFALIIASLVACENESGSSGPSIVESHVFINGARFEPSVPADSESYVTTSYEAGAVNGTANQRTFQLMQSTGAMATDKSMTIVVTYPISGNINGTYDFDPAEFDPANDVQASYSAGNDDYGFNAGSITVADLGGSKYRLTFSEAKLVNIASQGIELPVTGYFEGVFTEE